MMVAFGRDFFGGEEEEGGVGVGILVEFAAFEALHKFGVFLVGEVVGRDVVGLEIESGVDIDAPLVDSLAG